VTEGWSRVSLRRYRSGRLENSRAADVMKPDKLWRKLSAAEYAALYPAKPKALRKIAHGLRQMGAGNEVFTMAEWELADACDVGLRTLQRYIGVFESYGILEVKRWRYRVNGGSPSSYRVFLGNVIPEGFTHGGGDYPISAVERRREKDSGDPVCSYLPVVEVIRFWRHSLPVEGKDVRSIPRAGDHYRRETEMWPHAIRRAVMLPCQRTRPTAFAYVAARRRPVSRY